MDLWQPLIVCDTNCGFADLITLAHNLINDLVVISTLLVTIVFAYAGMLLLTSGGNPGKKDEVKKMFFKVIIGYLWILGAWLVVYTITTALLHDGYSLLGKP